MNRIDKKFSELKRNNRKAFIAFIMTGDPNIRMTEVLIDALAACGVDIVELGVPFSDPLADGPTIQAASVRALKNRISLDSTIRFVKRIRRHNQDIPIALLSYYNPIYKYGEARFIKDAISSGIDGLIVPDLPPEEGSHFFKTAAGSGFYTILLAAPTSTEKRLKKITGLSRGFIYYVSLTGTTGARKTLPEDITKNVRLIKGITNKPVCVGFGVSTPQQAKKILCIADGVIVGSAIIKIIEQNIGEKDLVKRVKKYVRQMKDAF